MLHYQGLSFVPKTVWIKLINRHHNNPLAGHFGIEKTCELLARNYFWPMLQYNVEAYVKGSDRCLALKAVRHKPYSDLQSLPIPTYCWKNLSMDFVTGLSISVDWKRDSYNSILVIVNRLTKMVYYKLVKITINTPGLAQVIIDIAVWHHGLPNSIVINRSSVFTSKFWSLLCYIFGINQRLSTAFYPRTDGQTKR